MSSPEYIEASELPEILNPAADPRLGKGGRKIVIHCTFPHLVGGGSEVEHATHGAHYLTGITSDAVRLSHAYFPDDDLWVRFDTINRVELHDPDGIIREWRLIGDESARAAESYVLAGGAA